MKLFKNKTFIGIICIIIGLAIGFVVIPKASDKANEQVNIAIANTFIEQGEKITADMMDTIEVDKKIAGEKVLSEDNIIGKYAITNIYTNDFITSHKISEILSSEDLLAIATQKGLRVVSITLPSLASSVSGRLQAGDVVTLMITAKNDNLNATLETGEEMQIEQSGAYIIDELKYLEVAMLTTTDASDSYVNANPTDDEKNRLPVTVSFFVTEKQALLLAEIERDSQIHIAFVARGMNTTGYIDAEKNVFSTAEIEIDTEVQE